MGRVGTKGTRNKLLRLEGRGNKETYSLIGNEVGRESSCDCIVNLSSLRNSESERKRERE